MRKNLLIIAICAFASAFCFGSGSGESSIQQDQAYLHWSNVSDKAVDDGLITIAASDWDALKKRVKEEKDQFPALAQVMSMEFPVICERSVLKSIVSECYRNIEQDRLNDPDIKAIATICTCAVLVLRQEEAFLKFDILEGSQDRIVGIISPVGTYGSLNKQNTEGLVDVSYGDSVKISDFKVTSESSFSMGKSISILSISLILMFLVAVIFTYRRIITRWLH